MSLIDWLILIITLSGIVLYGIWKSRGTRRISTFLLADRELPWYHVGLSVMATQASAITFLSAPGQGYTDGLRFVQFYFGLPLAMVVLCITFIPAFRQLNVYTAYEYLEQRFDGKTRALTAGLFLLQRGLSTGVTIYAPAIILSTILKVDLIYTIVFNGLIVIFYTVMGGTKAVSYTQVWQMCIIFGGLIVAFVMVLFLLPTNVGFSDALHVAGKMNKLNAVDTGFDLNNRYNIWSGLIGGFFLQLSYFGTDQSQVGRYLTGSSVKQSRLGLIMNGLVKIPMQFFILLIGVLVFVFYQFNTPPVFFNKTELDKLEKSRYAADYNKVQADYLRAFETKKALTGQLVEAIKLEDEARINGIKKQVEAAELQIKIPREKILALIKQNNPGADVNDSNFIFLGFVTQQLPVGVVGLLMAVIFLAAMGSTASGLNSLASTSVIDFYKRYYRPMASERESLLVSRYITLAWGLFCIVAAVFASRLGNLIEAVNILGSLFYGTILGIFLCAFYLKKVSGRAVFFAAIVAECLVISAWACNLMAFLWLNVLGCLMVILLAYVSEMTWAKTKAEIN